MSLKWFHVVFITISTLQRPIEQLLSRSIAEHMAKGQSMQKEKKKPKKEK